MIYKFGDWVRVLLPGQFCNDIGIVTNVCTPHKNSDIAMYWVVTKDGSGPTVPTDRIEPVCWQCYYGHRNEFRDNVKDWCTCSNDCKYDYILRVEEKPND